MEKDTDRTDRIFRERLANFEQTPDDQVWNKIAGRLRVARQKKFIYLVIRIAAGMTLLLSLGLGYYLLNRQNDIRQPAIVSLKAGDTIVHDSIRPERIRKTHGNQPERKTKERSDRLRPARKLYKGPEIVSLDAEAGSVFPRRNANIRDDKSPNAGREPVLLLPIYSRPGNELKAALPLKLEYSGKAIPMPADEYLLPSPGNFAEEPNDDGENKWILGGEFAPLYSYRTISSDYLNRDMMNSMNKSESGLVSYAGGIRVAYSAGRRLSVQSGVYYSRYGQEKNNVDAYMTSFNTPKDGQTEASYISISNSTGTIGAKTGKTDGTGVAPNYLSQTDYFSDYAFIGINAANSVPVATGNITATQFFDYLELPLTVKYKIVDRKIGFSLIGGMVTNFLVNNSVRLTSNGNTQDIGKTSDINKVNYLGSFGLGFDYPIIKNVAFSLEPRFRYYLNPIDQTSKINVHPYSFGIFAGFSYGF